MEAKINLDLRPAIIKKFGSQGDSGAGAGYPRIAPKLPYKRAVKANDTFDDYFARPSLRAADLLLTAETIHLGFRAALLIFSSIRSRVRRTATLVVSGATNFTKSSLIAVISVSNVLSSELSALANCLIWLCILLYVVTLMRRSFV
jgi:hypothetical protein